MKLLRESAKKSEPSNNRGLQSEQNTLFKSWKVNVPIFRDAYPFWTRQTQSHNHGYRSTKKLKVVHILNSYGKEEKFNIISAKEHHEEVCGYRLKLIVVSTLIFTRRSGHRRTMLLWCALHALYETH